MAKITNLAREAAARIATGQNLSVENVESLPGELQAARESLEAGIENMNILLAMLEAAEDLVDGEPKPPPSSRRHPRRPVQ